MCVTTRSLTPVLYAITWIFIMKWNHTVVTCVTNHSLTEEVFAGIWMFILEWNLTNVNFVINQTSQWSSHWSDTSQWSSHWSGLSQWSSHWSKTRQWSKSHRCGLCDKSFSDWSILRRHMNIHTELKPRRCDSCDKLLLQQIYLLKHANVYAGLTPCHKSFSHQNHLWYKNVLTGLIAWYLIDGTYVINHFLGNYLFLVIQLFVVDWKFLIVVTYVTCQFLGQVFSSWTCIFILNGNFSTAKILMRLVKSAVKKMDGETTLLKMVK